MTTIELPPNLAARLAEDVYALADMATEAQVLAHLRAVHAGMVDVARSRSLNAETGAPAMVRFRTAFGLCLVGAGRWRGHAFIVFRGSRYLADWLTNVNAGLARSAFQQPVHQGFQAAFASMRRQVGGFLTEASALGVAQVHCIGHSLGGALATLCAEWLRAERGTTAKLYTFGCPRVGLEGFCRLTTARLGRDNIYRAWHRTDIVPCMPIWPFMHLPDQGDDYCLASGGSLPGAEFHAMARYRTTVGAVGWAALRADKSMPRTPNGIRRWLQQEAPVPPTLESLEWLAWALPWVVEMNRTGAQRMLAAAFGTRATLLDQLAWMLHQGTRLRADSSRWTLLLVGKIMRLLGHGRTVEAGELSFAFCQSLLLQLHQRFTLLTRRALAQVLVEGRAL